MMRFYGFLVTALAFLFTAHANAGEMSFKIQSTSNGGFQFRILGSDLCDNYARTPVTSFRMTKGDIIDRSFVKSEEYTSASGKTEWSINKKDNCSINQQVSNDLLDVGKALKVTTISAAGIAVESFYLIAPCSQELFAFENQIGFFTETTLSSATVCDTGGADDNDAVIVQDVEQHGTTTEIDSVVFIESPSPQTEQSCLMSIETQRGFPDVISIKAGCSYADTLIYTIYANGRAIGRTQSVQVGASTLRNGSPVQLVDELTRDTKNSVRLEVEFFTSDTQNGSMARVQKTLLKSATFEAPVQARLLTAETMTPAAQEKNLGRGYYFESKISLQVDDADIEQQFPQKKIIVELINTTNNDSNVEIRREVAPGRVDFDISGQYVTPLFFGSDAWDDSYILQGGINTFEIRVYEAFSNTEFITLENIVINVRQ